MSPTLAGSTSRLEASRLVLADRDALLTDRDAMAPGALDHLLSAAHADELVARLDPDRRLPVPPSTLPQGGGTIYLATADRDGGAVSLIESNYAGFGSGVVDPVTGIAYQNRGAFFRLDPAHVNALAPGKRTVHTLTPGMLLRDGRAVGHPRQHGRRDPAAGVRPGRVGARGWRRGHRHGRGRAPLVRHAAGPPGAAGTARRSSRATTPR